mgnify:CR=1 FL=1
MISDGILPGNEGREYVLRRLLRRAVFHGRLLGIEGAFLTKFIDEVNAQMGEAYPELLKNVALVKGIVASEEERFSTTLDNGRVYLDEALAALAEGAVLPGDGFRGVGTERVHDDDGVTERERLKTFPEQAFAVVGEDQTRNGGFSGRVGTHARSLVREETTSRTAPATATASASESSGYMGRLRMRGMSASVTGRPSGASATLPR